MTRELLTINAVCARMSVCRRTVYNWLQSGKLAFVRAPGGTIRVYADSLTFAPDSRRSKAVSADTTEDPHQQIARLTAAVAEAEQRLAAVNQAWFDANELESV